METIDQYSGTKKLQSACQGLTEALAGCLKFFNEQCSQDLLQTGDLAFTSATLGYIKVNFMFKKSCPKFIYFKAQLQPLDLLWPVLGTNGIQTHEMLAFTLKNALFTEVKYLCTIRNLNRSLSFFRFVRASSTNGVLFRPQSR